MSALRALLQALDDEDVELLRARLSIPKPAQPARRTLLTSREFGEQVGLSPRALAMRARRGTLPMDTQPVRVGRSLRWRVQDLAHFTRKEV